MANMLIPETRQVVIPAETKTLAGELADLLSPTERTTLRLDRRGGIVRMFDWALAQLIQERRARLEARQNLDAMFNDNDRETGRAALDRMFAAPR